MRQGREAGEGHGRSDSTEEGGTRHQELAAANARRAAIGRKKPRHHLHGGGFARAVGAQKAKNLALGDGKRQPGHGRDRVKTLGEVFNFEHSPQRKKDDGPFKERARGAQAGRPDRLR